MGAKTMSIYSPDVWVIVELAGNKATKHHRILAQWYGGYAGSDEWRLSSGITKIVDNDTYWTIHNDSGSVYNCHKDYERFGGYSQRIYESYQKDNDEDLNMTHIPIADIIRVYPGNN
jgi:hypothetical protein